MVDQEGGLVKRVGGAPDASAREMGERGAAFSREQGRRTALNLRDIGVNVNLAPVLDVGRPGGTIAETDRAFGSTAAAVEGTAIPFAEALQAAGHRGHRQALPGLRLGPGQHRLRGAAARDLEGGAASGRRGAVPPLHRRRGRPGDAEHRDLPGLLRPPGGLHPLDRDRRAPRPPRLRRRLDHRRARIGRGEGIRRRREGGAVPAPARAPTSSYTPTPAPPAPASGR